jgi:hypothetical protein
MQSKNKNRERSTGGTVMRDHILGNALVDSLDSTRARGWKDIAVGHVILTYARNAYR